MSSLVFLFGFILRYWTPLTTRFQFLHIDPGDPRFNNFILEWVYRSFSHLDFARVWSPPLFYPTLNVLAYGDNLFGSFPLYALFRGVGITPPLSYQLWIMFLSVLNYYAAYFVLRKISLPRLACHLGSYFFAFSLPLIMKIGHAHFYSLFPVPLLFYSLFRFFENLSKKHLLLFSLLLGYQFYLTPYLGLFALFSSFPFSLGALCILKTPWRRILTLSHLLIVLLCFVVPTSLLAYPYLKDQREREPRMWSVEVKDELPTPLSYITPSDGTLYEPLITPFAKKRAYSYEHRLFVGFLPTILFGISLFVFFFKKKRTLHPFAKICLVVALCNLLITLRIGDYSFWWFVYKWIPGYSSLRGIARLHLVNIFFMSVFITTMATHFSLLQRKAALFLLLPLFLIDQWGMPGHRTSASEMEARTKRFATHLEEGEIFLVQSHIFSGGERVGIDIDTMWAAMEKKATAINGYSAQTNGFYPRLFLFDQLLCVRLNKYLLPYLVRDQKKAALLYLEPVGDGDPILQCSEKLYEKEGITKLIYPKSPL